MNRSPGLTASRTPDNRAVQGVPGSRGYRAEGTGHRGYMAGGTGQGVPGRGHRAGGTGKRAQDRGT